MIFHNPKIASAFPLGTPYRLTVMEERDSKMRHRLKDVEEAAQRREVTLLQRLEEQEVRLQN